MRSEADPKPEPSCEPRPDAIGGGLHLSGGRGVGAWASSTAGRTAVVIPSMETFLAGPPGSTPGDSLAQYSSKLSGHLPTQLTEQLLVDAGVKKIFHRKRILKWTGKLAGASDKGTATTASPARASAAAPAAFEGGAAKDPDGGTDHGDQAIGRQLQQDADQARAGRALAERLARASMVKLATVPAAAEPAAAEPAAEPAAAEPAAAEPAPGMDVRHANEGPPEQGWSVRQLKSAIEQAGGSWAGLVEKAELVACAVSLRAAAAAQAAAAAVQTQQKAPTGSHAHAPSPPSPDGLTAEHYCRHGISLAGLEYLRVRHGDQITAAATTSDVCHTIIKPATVAAGWINEVTLTDPDKRWFDHEYRETATGRVQPQPPPGTMSYCELLLANPATAHFVGRPTVFLSHAWLYLFLNVLAALRAFVGAQPAEAPEVFFWFDCFSIDEHATQALPPECARCSGPPPRPPASLRLALAHDL